MNHYDITIQWSQPYPKSETHRVEGTAPATVAGKALRIWRKNNKGKRINSIVVRIQRI